MFGSFSYQTKIFLSLAAFLLVVLTIINVIYYYRNESLMMNDLAQNKQQTTIKLQEQVDDMLAEMNKISISVNASDSIMDVLKAIPSNSERNYFTENPVVSADIKNTLLSFTSLQPLKGRISLVSRYGDYLDLSNKMDSIKIDKMAVRMLPIFQTHLGMEEYKRFLAPHPDPWSESEEVVISIVRPLRDNYNVYGYVEISYSVKELENIFFFRNDLTFGNILILDANRHILFSSLPAALDRSLESDSIQKMSFDGEFGHFEWRSADTRKMVFYSKLASTDWNIMLVEDLSAFRRPIEYLRYSSITIFFAALFVMYVLLYLYTNRVTRPLRRLKDSLANVDLAKPELLPSKLRTRNEITLLGVAFQGLLDELKLSMQQAENYNQRALVAQMNALQAQVDPHFLHNTLTVIAAYGKNAGNPKVAEMCIALSDMLRYTMKFDRKDSTIGAEIENVERYLTIMQNKYEGFLDVEMDIDPGMRIIPIPRLSLQPLVENAFHHGFAGIEPPWKLSVKGTIDEGRWQIAIRDNGIGLSPALLERVRHQVDKLKDNPGTETERLAEAGDGKESLSSPQGNGIGLVNVIARLVLFYGSSIEFSLNNVSGGGAECIIAGRR